MEKYYNVPKIGENVFASQKIPKFENNKALNFFLNVKFDKRKSCLR